MSLSDRSKLNPNPCNTEQEAQNWRVLHRLLSRLPLEPTEDDDGKLMRWNNTQKRWNLVDPCVATMGCGGSGGECATAGTWASGITSLTKVLTLGGGITATGCASAADILAGSPYTLTCNGGDQYTYLDFGFACGILAITLDLFETSATVNISVGTLTGGAVWTLSSLTAPYDYETAINGSYTLTTNDSSQFDAASLTATISA